MSHLTIDYINAIDGKYAYGISDTLKVLSFYDSDYRNYRACLHDSVGNTITSVLSTHRNHRPTSHQLVEGSEIYGNMILISTNDEHFLLTKNPEGYTKHSIESSVYSYMKRSLKLPPSEPEWLPTGLSQIRSNGNFDFVIVSRDSKTYNVHSLVLAGVWPLFKTMLEANMKETSEKQMDIPYPHTWVEALLLYFYEEELTMDFNQATGVVVLANVYDIPALCDIAITRIKKETLDTKKCVEGWRNVFEARCDSMQIYLAKYLGEHLKELQEASEMLAQFSQEETVQLMMDISRSKA